VVDGFGMGGEMKTEDVNKICSHLSACFTSPNVSDSNFEAANMVDVLDDVARGLFAIAKAIDGLAETVRDGSKGTE
jgi:hypothetical protein